MLNHWHNKGILDDNRTNKTGWRKLNTIEILWINIIKKLRVFGFDLDKIRLVKKNLESFNLSKKKGEFAVLDFYLAYSIVSKKPVKLLVFSNGDTIIGRQVDKSKAIFEILNIKDPWQFTKKSGYLDEY